MKEPQELPRREDVEISDEEMAGLAGRLDEAIANGTAGTTVAPPSSAPLSPETIEALRNALESGERATFRRAQGQRW